MLTSAVPRRVLRRRVRNSRIGQPDLLGVPAQPEVGVDRARVPDGAHHRHVVERVAVRVGRGQVDVLALGELADRRGLGLAVHQVADEPAGVEAVLVLGDGAEAPVAPSRRAMSAADLDRRRGHEPHLVAGGEVLVEQPLGAGEDAQLQHLVVDVLADRGDLRDGAAAS